MHDEKIGSSMSYHNTHAQLDNWLTPELYYNDISPVMHDVPQVIRKLAHA